ncbi:MAG TPA: hypothetical protein VFL93_07205 [Longimicrobiaceae bacterium]|nr:hypothetical protein [Longimicrobiaceae bacterium]
MARADVETALLEAGLAAALALLVAGAGMLVFGRIAGGARRSRRRHEGPPAAGSVPDERHQHTATVSSR